MNVTWKLGVDNHRNLIDLAGYKDCDDTQRFVRCEVAPKNGDYFNPDKWIFRVDDETIPRWFSPSHREAVLKASRQYRRQLFKIVIKNKKIIHPFNDIKFKGVITSKHILLLKTWNSVCDSVRYSVRDSVRGSVGGSVRDSVRGSVGGSVWDSVWGSVSGSVRGSIWDSIRGSIRDSVGGSVSGSVSGSVWDSVWDSVLGYIGSFFRLQRNQWKYTEKIKIKNYPFQSVVDLWNMGLVPSFDGEYWRLHSGKKAKVVFKIKKKDLMKLKLEG